jgi:UDP-galactopyranose mutase
MGGLKKILVVGAGFSGAVIARELAETGNYHVDVIDKRDHIAGNAYDEIHQETGVRYHKYGPHIFHTNDKRIFDYLSQFTEWLPYQHRVEAWVEGVGHVPLPVNMTTINRLYGLSISSEEELNAYLERVRITCLNPKSASQFLENIYGAVLTELFFSRYTEKMWGLSLREMHSSVVARLPVRKDDNPYYFNDSYQCMPAKGYTHLIGAMLEHEAIAVALNTTFSKSVEKSYSHVFNSMPIDEYFDFEFGELPYRSIKFEHRVAESFSAKVPTVNFTDISPYTRKTNWKLYPGCGGGEKELVTYEEPCDYRDNNMERYYPVKTLSGEPQEIYRKYKRKAETLSNITFVGRCGQYIYYDMHQVVGNSLGIVGGFIEKNDD